MSRLVETSRRTRDLDFSVRQISGALDNLLRITGQIATILLQDGFLFEAPTGEVMKHPRMPYMGARIKINFIFGSSIKGSVWMDFALGDEVEPVNQPIYVLRYKAKPLIGEDFTLFAYPPEFVFAEKYQTAVFLGAANSRMKDFYDMLQLSNPGKLVFSILHKALQKTFEKRKTEMSLIKFSAEEMPSLDGSWKNFLKRNNLEGVLQEFSNVVEKINSTIEKTLAEIRWEEQRNREKKKHTAISILGIDQDAWQKTNDFPTAHNLHIVLNKIPSQEWTKVFQEFRNNDPYPMKRRIEIQEDRIIMTVGETDNLQAHSDFAKRLLNQTNNFFEQQVLPRMDAEVNSRKREEMRQIDTVYNLKAQAKKIKF